MSRLTGIRGKLRVRASCMKRAGLTLVLAAVLPHLNAQSSNYFGRRVVRVEYSPAKQPIDPIDLRASQL